MKRVSGNIMALIGLLLGLGAGFGVVWGKQYLIKEIVGAVQDEVTASCPTCTLTYDSFSISLLRLRGRATNIAITDRGVPRLSFKDINASFSISEIAQKKIHIDTLVLSDGNADGVGPDSVTFRFIDQLTTPLPPEKQNTDRWRAILETLELKGTHIRESFGSSELRGDDLGLFVKRIGETFVLLPKVEDLTYRSFLNPAKTEFSDLPLGPLFGSIVIDDTRTVFNSLKVGRGPSLIEIKGSSDNDHDNLLTGTSNYTIDPSYIGLPTWLAGLMTGSGEVKGSLGSPIITGSLSQTNEAPLTLAFPNASPIQFSSMNGNLSVDVNHGDPLVTVTSLTGKSGDASLASTQPLTFSDRGLFAGFDIALPSFSYGPFSVLNAKAKVSIKPRGEDTLTALAVQASDLLLQGQSLGPAKLNITIDSRSVSVTADSTDARYGQLHWEGTVATTLPEALLKDGKLQLTNYRYPLSTPADPLKISPVSISATLPLSGPIDLAKLSGEGPTTIAFPALRDGFEMNGRTKIKDGTLSINLPTSTHKGTSQLKIDLTKTFTGKLSVNLPQIPLSQFIKEGDCGVVDATVDYGFSLSAPLSGSGSIGLGDLHIGCEPYVLQLPKNTSLAIAQGALKFKGTKVTSGNSALELNGSIGFTPGLDLSLAGDLHLSSLLPLLPSLDNLRGLLSTKISVKGPLDAPTFSGAASLSKGELALASPDIAAQEVNGKFILSGDLVKVESLSGTINNGTFDVKGSLSPFNISRSDLTANLKQVTVEPASDASITFSGRLGLEPGRDRKQTLTGDIGIDFAEISKDFNLNRILVQTIKGYFIPSRIQPQLERQGMKLDLDVRLSAPRNIFVLTPFFSAELNAQIRATGTTSDPILDGSMHLLSGWVGLKGNRFDVTAGSLQFKPGSLTPTIEIASEGVLRAPSGESVLVILEASGPLTSPRIALASDRGLSQQDLLLLITSSRSLTGRTMANRSGTQFTEDQRFFLSQDSFSSFGAFFRNLTRLDILSFEPTYNQYTGLVEPAVVARKNLTPRFALVGSSLFSAVSNSKAGAVYNLTPSLDINAFIQTVSTQQNAIASSDLTYTILSEQPTLVEITFKGLDKTDEQSLLAAARIGRESNIQDSAESLNTIQRSITSYLNQQGFLASSVEVSCRRSTQYCQDLLINVYEGRQSSIANTVLQGEPLPPALAEKVARLVRPGTVASSAVLQEVERELVIALRNEGYVAARVSPTYRATENPDSVDLLIECTIREPISFVFSGNKVFSAEQFLDSIDFFTRKRPFGNNTVKLLVENIGQMYQESGYLFAQVSYSEDRSDPARLTYLINISEESETKVRALKITGNTSLSEKEIKRAMSTLGFGEQLGLLTPTYAIASQLDTLRKILESVFQQEGFPEATVEYTIEPVENGKALDIIFKVVEGPAHRAPHITVVGFPSELPSPELPALPASLPRVNQAIERILQTLQEEGYLFPSTSIELSGEDNGITITVIPGVRTTISAIRIEGLNKIERNVASKYFAFTEGSPYRLSDVNQTKRELLRSGLFSRVEILPTDGTLDAPQEQITVKCSERALETLEVGTGANSEFGLHVFGEAVDKSLFSDGRTLSMRIDSYFDQAQINPSGSSAISQGFANVRYLDPFFLGSNYSLTEELRFQRQELSTQEFNLDRLLLASYVFRQYDSGFTFTGGHSLSFDNLVDVTPGAIISPLDEGFVRLSFLSGVFKLDRRDDPLLPRSGYTFTLEPKLSLEGIGSNANYGTLVAKSTGVVPLRFLSSRFSLGLGATAGLSEPFGDTDQIPITQRFYLGGRTTVRGFKENSLGPRGSDGAVIGGDTMLAQKNQLQYLLSDSLSSHLFMDFGNVFLRHDSFSLGDIRSSTGLGLQYLSPIGPIGFDLGHPLNRKENESTLRFHFSVGSTF